jgi:ATP-binding cassette, subfamily B, bacterial
MHVRALLRFARPYRFKLAICIALMLAETASSLAIPWLGGQFAGRMLAAANKDARAILLALLALFAIQAALKFVNGYILGRTAEQVLADLRIRIYDHLQALPLSFHHESIKGDILALITNEVGQLSSYITSTLPSIVPLLLTVTGAVVLMFRIDPQLGALVAVMVPVFFLMLKVIGRRLRPLASQLQQAQAAAVAIAEENLGMLPAIKSFTRESEESLRHSRQIRRVLELSTLQQRIYAGLEPAIQFTAAAGTVILLWVASARVSAGTMTPDEIVSFLLYAALLTRPVSGLANLYGRTQVARGALSRLGAVLSVRPEDILATGASLKLAGGDIKLRNVSFTYPGRPSTLQDIDLHFHAGEIVALTGENGAGKSTLVHLLLRLYEPDSGQILIDGTDITKVSLQSLRSQIGLVPQRALLFNGTVRDNIRFGKSDARDREIEAAARAAQAHKFITHLPKGYDTIIGDQGVRLSGGQQQRLALARALLKSPKILILDEATSMFDPEGERALVEECRHTLAGRTVILITHRPASLALADRIVKLEKGRVMPAPNVLAS